MMGISGVLASRGHAVFPLRDLAWGLGRIPRFGGQTIHKWFVADHLVASARYARTLTRWDIDELHVLLHDAHEAYTGDIPTTFKTPDMRALQQQLDSGIYETLGVAHLWPLDIDEERFVKHIDRMMLRAEALVVTPKTTFHQIEIEQGAVISPDPAAVEAVWGVLRTGQGQEWYNEVTRLISSVTTPAVVGFDPGDPGEERTV